MLIFFTSSSVRECQVNSLAWFCLFTVMYAFMWFCMGTLCKSIQLILEFLKAPFMVFLFSYYTFMTFLIILSAMLVFMLMIVLFNLSVKSHLICGNNKIWLMKLERLKTECGIVFLIWILEKTHLVPFYQSHNSSDGSVLEEKPSFKMLELYFSFKLD